MDKVVEKIAALGVPGLVLLIAINATGLTGAAAITAGLAAIGPGGMLGGIAILGAGVLISGAIAKYGFRAIYKGVINELQKRGTSKADIIRKIEGYPLSKDMKRMLIDHVNRG